jgi:hypothetical protein
MSRTNPKQNLTSLTNSVKKAAIELSEEELGKIIGGNMRHEMLKSVVNNLRS